MRPLAVRRCARNRLVVAVLSNGEIWLRGGSKDLPDNDVESCGSLLVSEYYFDNRLLVIVFMAWDRM